jgi:hypothetical protein
MCGILNFMQMNEYKSTNPSGAEKPTQPPEGLHILHPFFISKFYFLDSF